MGFATVMIVILSYLISRTNYLLYHILIELFSVFTCLLIFLISTFSKKYSGVGIIEVIGAGFIYIAAIDFIHTLSYRGMNVFTNLNSDFTTQMWIIARFIQALILLSGILLINKKPKYYAMFAFYTVVSFTLVILPFMNLFPTCFVEGVGLIEFKIIAEYFIILLLVIAIFLIRRNKERIIKTVRQTLCLSISFAIMAELAFTLYTDSYGVISALGHTFKLLSTLILLSLIIDYGLRDTYKNFFTKLSSEKEFLKTILQSINDAVIVTNKQGEIISMNWASEALLNVNLEEVSGQKFDEVIHVYDRNTRVRIKNLLEKLLETDSNNSSQSNFLISVSNDDKIIDIKVSLVNENPIIQTVVVISDITTFVNMEVGMINQQRLQSVGVLANSVAHEINNPIMGIINYSQLILDQKAQNESINNYATEIISESNRIADIVKNLLSFSKQQKNEWNEYDVKEIINSSSMLINTFVIKDNIELKIDIDDHLQKIYCNKQEILQVIINLMVNAKEALNEKYKQKPGVKEISIKCEKHKRENKDYIRFIIKDNGTGLTKKAREHIFIPFFTTKINKEGTGLGVPISHEIIKRHHGYLEFNSVENEYTEAVFELPAVKEEVNGYND